jgi:outer membrane protein assembly factor BamD
MMLSGKLSALWGDAGRAGLLKSLALVMLCAAVGACSTTVVDKTLGMTPAELYAEAKDEMSNQQIEKAIGLYEKLEARAAGTPLALQAQLDKAYAYYLSREPVMALATIDRFIRMNPASPAMDYAYYLKGVVTFNNDLGMFGRYTGQDLAERDQKAARESFDAFKELVTRFPQSRYAEDARQRMGFTVSALAKYDVVVAKYYFRRGAYLAAINRAQNAVSEYRNVPAVEDALFLIYKAYDVMGLPAMRDDARRVLAASFPDSQYLGPAGEGDDWLKR